MMGMAMGKHLGDKVLDKVPVIAVVHGRLVIRRMVLSHAPEHNESSEGRGKQ